MRRHRPGSSALTPGDALAVSDDEESRAVFRQASFQRASFRPEPFQTGRGRALLSSEHFRLSYPQRVARNDAEAFLRALETARADIVRRVERASLVASIPDMKVFVYDTTGDFVGATGEAAWVAAVTGGGQMQLQPLETLRRRGVLSTTPRHELVHAALEALGHGRAPRWLVEGLAAYVAGEGPMLSRVRAPRSRLDELERRLANPASAEETRTLYAAAYAEVAALIRREGEAAAWRLAAR